MKDYLEILTDLENRKDTTLKEVEDIEKEINKLDLDENTEIFIKNKIMKLKSRVSNYHTRKWDLFLNDISKIDNIEDVITFLNKIDDAKDKTLNAKEISELEAEYNKILPILHDQEKFSTYYRDFCIREVNKKIKVFHNRLDREVNPKFGEKLKELRESKGMSLKDLEYVSGVTASYINRIENGKRKPSVAKIEKLADALDVDVQYFLDMLNISHILKNTNDLIEFIEKHNYTVNGKAIKKRQRKILNEIIKKIVNDDWYSDEDNFDRGVEIAELAESFHN